MIPILYKSAEVDFTTNGLGLLNDIYSVDIQEQRNGLLTLTASYPTNAKHYKEIETGRIIYAKPNPLDGAQAFRIVKTELDISGYNLNIEADHITYDLTHNLVKEVHLQGDGQNAMTHLQNATVTPHLFRFVSDLQHLGDSRLQYVNPMEAIAGTEGSILQIWGGELHRDNRIISMLSRRGRDNFTTFRLGKNINGLKYTVDMSNVTTRIVPTVTKSDATDNDKAYFVVGDTVDSKNLNKYPNVYIQHVDMGEKVTINEGETDEQIKAKIDKQAKNWFTQSANTGIDLPQVTVEIDVTSLQDSADYQEKFRNLESVGLTDTVSVYVPEFNVNVTAIVNELHYDPVAERVTSLVVGTSKKSFADNNSNALAELQNSITQIRQDATTAIVSSNGKNTNYYGTEEPAHPVEGDLWFKQVGDETYLMIFKDGRWQEWVSTKTQEEIAKKVDDAVKKAKEYTDELNEKQAEEVQKFQSEANAALSSAAAERTVFSSNAASMASSVSTHADSMADSAAVYAKAQAASALSSANSALSEAKSDLTTSIEQEISDRNQAVSAVNSQAQDYATQAKSDAIEAAKTADGQVRKDFKVTTDALSSTISQNKQDSDGKISTAQSTATQALNGLKTKVSQTDYNTKTGRLQTDLTATTQTANQAKTDIASIKSEADSQSAQINDIVSDARGTKQTVSDLKTEQGKQSGSIATLQSRADGFDATVTKVDSLSVGGRNLLIGSNSNTKSSLNPGNGSYTTQYVSFSNGYKYNFSYTTASTNWAVYMFSGLQKDKFTPNTDYVLSFMINVSTDIKPMVYFANGSANHNFVKQVTYPTILSSNGDQKVVIQLRTNPSFPDESDQSLYINGFVNKIGTFSIWDLKIETGNLATDWTPAPEDLSGATAKAQLTADNAALAIKNYKTDADGRISKAQSDITATANEVKTKVSQSDFDTKTGDLTTKYGEVKATADTVTNDVAKYKKSNDGRVSANEANIKTLSGQITSKVSKTDLDKATGELNGKFTQQQQTVDSISQTVTELQAKANSQGQVNQLLNTEFTPDLEGWAATNNDISYVGINKTVTVKGSNVLNITHGSNTNWSAYRQQISNFVAGDVVSASVYARKTAGNWAFSIDSYDSAGTRTIIKQVSLTMSDTLLKIENVTIPSDAKELYFSFWGSNAGTAVIYKPMLVFNSTVGDYVQGNYNNNARVAAVEIDLNGITGLVNDPKKGLSATAALAANGLSVATKAQNKATTAIQTADGTQTTVESFQKDVKDLQSKTTRTAGQVTTEIQDRKNGDSSVKTDLSSLIDQRVKETKSGYESYFSQQARGIIASVSMPNKLINTEFTPDLEGWSGNSFISYVAVNKSTKKMGSNVLNITHSTDTGWGQYNQKISNFMAGGVVSASVYAREDSGNWVFTLDSYDVTGKRTILKSVNVTTGYTLLKIENVTIPSDAVELRYSFWCQTAGMLLIAQPMLVFSNTVPTYMPGSYSGINTSTVLELFKDNWALGIADNSGKIISGINGDTSGTVIQGKKLVINSDTTINGKAFINGAVIKDGSISHAQIGNAAIGSAQIINVDVSKISGNIANFITGNISRLNSHVLYGDTGHLTTVDTGLIINNQDDHLQLASHGQYDVPTKRAQFELLGYANNIDRNMQGSLNYYKNPHNKGTGLGIRFLGNQILAIDEAVATGNLYLSPYATGQVQVVNRDRNGFQDIKASKFVTSSERKYKSEINEFNDDALELVNGLNIRRYIKNNEDEIGVIADEADERILDKTNTGVDLYSFVSVVAKAVQELSAQVKELQNERPNN